MYKLHFTLCRTCPKHQELQDSLKANFDPTIGLQNLTNAWKEFNYDIALINSIQVQQNHQSTGIADTEELDAGDTTYTNTVLVNQLRIGKACTPFEVIKVKTAAGYYPIVLIYDTGAQVSLCNHETGPLLIQSKQADKRVTISTISSSTATPRAIHTLDLGNGYNMDAILSPGLRLTLREADIPDEWQGLEDTFANQDHSNVEAQILVGADKAKLFPVTVTNPAGEPIETEMCRLMRSRITNRLIVFGACKDQGDDPDRINAKTQIHQTEETNTSSITQNLAISTFDPVDTTTNNQ